MNHPGAPDPETLSLLKAEFGPDLLTSTGELAARGRDDSGLFLPPAAVLLARDETQISRLLVLANERRFAVIPRGAGTGLAGACLAETGGVVLDMSAMNRIITVDEKSVTATVEPGVLNIELRRAAAAKGLFYPPDPASLDTSTLGGNAATNAGGPACVKYGTTRDYVLGLSCVLPTGEALRVGTATRKGVVGYDLTRLIVGSEGTLGVITSLTLKLLPLPEGQACVAAVFADVGAAMRAISAVMTRGHLPSAIEFLDARCLRLVGDLLPAHVRAGLPGAPGEHGEALVLIECDGGQGETRRAIADIESLCRECGALGILPAPDEAARQAVWDVRRSVSTRIHESCVVYIPEDIAVPVGRIADMVAALPPVEARHGIDIYAFGHAGDGNIHLNLTAPSEARRPAVEAAAEECVRLALGFGGTMSGEHGVGLAKRRMLPLEIAPVSLRLQRGIKKLFDPNDILNPGKIFPEEAC